MRWCVYFKRKKMIGCSEVDEPWNEGFEAGTEQEALEKCRAKYGNAEKAIPSYQLAGTRYYGSYDPDRWKRRYDKKWRAPDKVVKE